MKTEEEKNIENKPLEDTDTVALPPFPQKDPVLGYTDGVEMNNETLKCFDPNDLDLTIELESEVKLFAKKFKYHERECCKTCDECNGSKCCEKPSQGDYFGFTLVFGNYGDQLYQNLSSGWSIIPTLTDILDLMNLPSNSQLTIVDLCIPDCYRLIRPGMGAASNRVINPCAVTPNNTFNGKAKYTLTLQKCTEADGQCDASSPNWRSNFDIPCHYVCSISILCKVDPIAPCTPCSDNCR